MRSFKHLLFSLSLLTIILPAVAALPPGTQMPEFTAPASLDGNHFTFSIEKALANGPVVVYFFPAAFTRGCDLEAHTFSTKMDQFKKAGASVIGISADSIKRLDAFSADPDYCAGKFPVASDPHGKIAASFGLAMQSPKKGVTDVRGDTVTHGFLPRTTFVINAKGKVVASMSSKTDGLTPVDHVEKSLAMVKKLQQNGHR